MRLLLLAITALFSLGASAAPPVSWVDAVTRMAGSGNQFSLVWDVSLFDSVDYFDVMVIWYERPNRITKYKFTTAQLTLEQHPTDIMLMRVSSGMKLPGTGHFSFQLRSCNEFGCSDWTNSLDPTHSYVNGKNRAWWAYGYLEAPGGVVPLPNASPLSGPEQ